METRELALRKSSLDSNDDEGKGEKSLSLRDGCQEGLLTSQPSDLSAVASAGLSNKSPEELRHT